MTKAELLEFYNLETERFILSGGLRPLDPEKEFEEFLPYLERIYIEKTHYKNFRKKIQEYKRLDLKRNAKDLYTEKNLSAFLFSTLENNKEEIFNKYYLLIRNHFLNDKDISVWRDRHYKTGKFFDKGRLSQENLKMFIIQLGALDYPSHPGLSAGKFSISQEYLDKNSLRINKIIEEILCEKLKNIVEQDYIEEIYLLFRRELRKSKIYSDLDFRIKNSFSLTEILKLISENSNFRKISPKLKEEIEQIETEIKIHGEMLERIPEHLPDLYPFARSIKRHFILHVGSTNSGKTYTSIKDLENSESGIYLAPLRLLAYEQYERINRDGFSCSLITGEEKLIQPGARFQSSTVEMLDTMKHYETCVIDECQMISDRERGGGWTEAILGVFADRIHVCMAPEACEIVESLIKSCGDSYETEIHKRQTPLKFQGRYNFPDDVKKGDAFIVFSRKSVYMAASVLREKKIRCSLIYGALPYDVRHEQADLFAKGENSVVVATDAIGMGMNLPIKRIVFLETDKFDGLERRPLKPSEAKQIAGRAGRFGMYDTGYVSSVFNVKLMAETLQARTESIKKARVNFPENIITIPGKLSVIIDQWMSMPLSDIYERNVTEREKILAKRIEDLSPSKQLSYDFITMPFQEDNKALDSLWYEMFLKEKDGDMIDIDRYLQDLSDSDKTDIDVLEENYKISDLLFHYCDKFDHKEYLPKIMDVKRSISDSITAILYIQPFKRKSCRGCGRDLPWNYPYKFCLDCYHAQKRGQRRASIIRKI